MTDERTIWNAKYAEGSHRSLEPDPFMIQAYEDYLLPLLGKKTVGLRALDVAGGVGRNAIWLARQQGWNVTMVDISDEAIAIAKRNGESAGVKFNLRVAGAVDFFAGIQQAQFDLILIFFFLQRELFPALVEHLRLGGLLIYKTYTVEQPKQQPGQGPSHPMHLLKPNELLQAFSSLEILFYRETVKDRGIAELVARKKLV